VQAPGGPVCGADATPHTRICTDPSMGNASRMGKQVSVYVRDEDAEVWARAERYAKARRMPVSGLIMAALEAYLADADDDR
jgi:hypothetical protein